jgi:transglutaminase-like putative cysteine protease
MNRRSFVGCVAAGAAAGVSGSFWRWTAAESVAWQPPAYEIIPVVGDGKWIWTEPPKEKGYLEPRQYDLSIGIQLEGQKGSASAIKASTPVPLELPEQQIDDVAIDTVGCAAEIRRLTPEAGQLFLAAPSIEPGQTIVARARYRLTLRKQYHAYEKDQFVETPEVSKEFKRLYLQDSPGIQTRHKAVRELVKEISGQLSHAWDKARAYHAWVWENIAGRQGRYTNVVTALKDRVGDCEEKAAVFVALCRASDIPARLVWVPNHNWAEIYLTNEQKEGVWIPVHTSCYSWFGWTGVHKLVLQKGDSIPVPESSKPQRLIMDWMQQIGSRPGVHYFADIRPLPPSGESDPGPGTQSKQPRTGEWTPLVADGRR